MYISNVVTFKGITIIFSGDELCFLRDGTIFKKNLKWLEIKSISKQGKDCWINYVLYNVSNWTQHLAKPCVCQPESRYKIRSLHICLQLNVTNLI